MSHTLVVLQMVVAALPYVDAGVEKLIAWINAVRQAAKQSGEWTPEMEAAWRSGLWARTKAPEYRPDQP